MDNSKKLLDLVMESPRIKNMGLRREAVETIIKVYNDAILSTMLSEGFIELADLMRIDIIKIQSRVHVLRGQEYHSTRKYKLKAYMTEETYEKVNDSFSLLE